MLCFFLRQLDSDSILSSNDHSSRHAAEKSMVDHSANILDILGHFSSILDSSFKVKIDNVVSVISYSDFITIGLVA
jgi:hypothetical protein